MKKFIIALTAAIALATVMFSCKDSKSYAELLTSETHAVNAFLVDQRVTNTIPTDTNFVFETGPNAPYYRLDEEGSMYMQVLNPGTKGNYAKSGQVIYFRFTRYNLFNYKNGDLGAGNGNETDMEYINAHFKFMDFSNSYSYQYGAGVQMPLYYLPIDAEVNIVIKSQYGFYEEQSYVQPYLYRLRFFPQQT
ncbi:MAG: DUF4827 family protein [Muribaculaceae bacterium]